MKNRWKEKLDTDIKGNIAPTMSNFVEIFRNDEALASIHYNELNRNIEVDGKLPWNKIGNGWTDNDFANLSLYLESNYGLYSPIKCKESLNAYFVSEKRINPLKRYLESLEWDGVLRIENMLVDYLGADNTIYVREVTKKTIVAAVARILQPGIKFDNVLVLCGPQGIGKSTLFRKLGKSWFSDSLTVADMKDKTGSEKLRGIWIMELSELAGLRKVDVETVKSFISRNEDRYRQTYGQYVENYPRNCIIVGSTNSTNGFLRDITGNRRFWPVNVSINSIKSVWDMDDEYINQIWAEGVNLFKNHEKLYLEGEAFGEGCLMQDAAIECDPKQGLVENFLETKDKVCLMEIWCECLKKERAEMKKSDSYELESILNRIGTWKIYDKNSSGKTRFDEYGIQKTFVRR